MSIEERGTLVVKCRKVGGDTLALYGFTAAYEQEVDLLDPATPANIRALDYATAWNMAHDPGFELGAKVAVGDWIIVAQHPPMVTR